MSRKKYNIRLQANEAYDDEMDSLSLREQNERMQDSPRRVDNEDLWLFRRVVGTMLYAVYVTLQFLAYAVHDLAVWVRGEGEFKLRSPWH